MKPWRPCAAALLLASTLACSEVEEPAPKAAPHTAFPPLTASGYRVEWGVPSVPCILKAGTSVPVSVVVKNIGDGSWPDIPSADPATGRGAVRLGYRWWSEGDAKRLVADYAAQRGDLRAPLGPGGSATMTALVTAPSAPGTYLLQLDLVEELVVWFESRGAAKLMVPVTVN